MKQLFDSELKVMEPLWNNGPLTASELTKCLENSCGWNKNTTYTVIKKLITKGAIARSEPNFLCTPLISREEEQKWEIVQLIQRIFKGSKPQFISALVQNEILTPDEIQQMHEMVEGMEIPK